MKRILIWLILVAGFLPPHLAPVHAEPWPGWRGPRGDGTCLEPGIPTNWDPANAVWKTELPGVGHASPIVWGDRVFTATAQSVSQQRIPSMS